jgi:hypothetical protein
MHRWLARAADHWHRNVKCRHDTALSEAPDVPRCEANWVQAGMLTWADGDVEAQAAMYITTFGP